MLNDRRCLGDGQHSNLGQETEGRLRRQGTLRPEGAPCYEALFQEQLLTAVVGVGFDEGGAHGPVDHAVEEGLLSRGFRRDDQAALGRLRAGRRPLPQFPGAHFFLPGATWHRGRSVDAVVTLVRASDFDSGPGAAAAFLDGLDRCDVALYGGHGCYGTGPDFGSLFVAELLNRRGEVVARFRSCRDLERALALRARPLQRSAAVYYRHLVRKGLLRLWRVSDGSLIIHLRRDSTDELGSQLMVDLLKTDPCIRRTSQHRFRKKYRCWLFNGCQTADYFFDLRSHHPEANAGGLDLYGTRRTVYWGHMGTTLLAFLDGLLRQQAHLELLRSLEAMNPPGTAQLGPSHVADVVVP